MTCEDSFQFSDGSGSGNGWWIFEESKKGFAIQRLADGCALTFSGSIRINRQTPKPIYVDGLHVDIIGGLSPGGLRLGTAYDWDGHFIQPGQKTQIHLEWQGSMAALEAFESQRAGTEPQFFLNCRGNIEFLDALTVAVPSNPPTTKDISVRTTPMSIWCQLALSFPKDAWVAALNNAGLRQALLLEIPLPPNRPEPWAVVWQAVDEARRYFDQGGTTGWNGCVMATRKALDTGKRLREKRPSGAPTNHRGRHWKPNRRGNDLRGCAGSFCSVHTSRPIVRIKNGRGTMRF
ncbi:MAG: hypothetical protein ACYDEV_00435 [Acidiferrobacter sp.]